MLLLRTSAAQASDLEPLVGHAAAGGKDDRSRRCLSCRAALATPLVISAGVLAAVGFGRSAVFDGTPSVRPLTTAGLASVTQEWSLLSMGLSAYSNVLGGLDPYKFQCPLPGLAAMAAINSTLGSTSGCCAAYDELGWPYQFPDCTAAPQCTTCWLKTASSDLLQHPVAPLAAVAWAASLGVYSDGKPKSGWLASKLERGVSGFLGGALHLGGSMGDSVLRDHRIHADLEIGLDSEDVDVCPQVADWEEVFLNDDKENIHARLFKSKSAKLAVVVFRGTQMTSMKNWEIDANLVRTKLPLTSGFPDTEVHEGFFKSLERILPRVKTWLNGFMFGTIGEIPNDWIVLFTGHSLGGALATLATTMAELEGWDRKPDATIVFGAPRVADAVLGSWWKAKGMCSKLLRINTYNDVIHYMPLKTAVKWWEVAQDLMKCTLDLSSCLHGGLSNLMAGSSGDTSFSDRWEHLCGPESEFVVESSVKGINKELKEFNLLGGALAHSIDHCLYGYSYGVLRSDIVAADRYCGVAPTLCSVA